MILIRPSSLFSQVFWMLLFCQNVSAQKLSLLTLKQQGYYLDTMQGGSTESHYLGYITAYGHYESHLFLVGPDEQHRGSILSIVPLDDVPSRTVIPLEFRTLGWLQGILKQIVYLEKQEVIALVCQEADQTKLIQWLCLVDFKTQAVTRVPLPELGYVPMIGAIDGDLVFYSKGLSHLTKFDLRTREFYIYRPAARFKVTTGEYYIPIDDGGLFRVDENGALLGKLADQEDLANGWKGVPGDGLGTFSVTTCGSSDSQAYLPLLKGAKPSIAALLVVPLGDGTMKEIQLPFPSQRMITLAGEGHLAFLDDSAHQIKKLDVATGKFSPGPVVDTKVRQVIALFQDGEQ